MQCGSALLSLPLDSAAVCTLHFATFALSLAMSVLRWLSGTLPVPHFLWMRHPSVVMQQYHPVFAISKERAALHAGTAALYQFSLSLVGEPWVCTLPYLGGRGSISRWRSPVHALWHLVFPVEWLGMHNSSPAGHPEHLARTPTLHPNIG